MPGARSSPRWPPPPSNSRGVAVVLCNALIEPVQLAEQIADDGVGPARQLFEQASGLAALRVGLQRQHVAELRKKSTDAVDAGGARLHEPLARPVHHELAL